MARKKYSCDFETTTDPNDCRVWAYGWMEIGKTENYKIGNSLETFMKWTEKTKADLYFHNLKFDGSFIVNWLLKQGFEYNDSGLPKTFNALISNMGQWYMIDICYGYQGKTKLHTRIYDSLKKLPFSAKQVAIGFKLDVLKGDIDYHAYRPIGHVITDDEHAYIKNDIEIIAKALEIQFKQGLTKMTSGSDSLAGFKSIISEKQFKRLFPVLPIPLDSELRKAYRGGFTWLNEKYAGKDINKGVVFDVNSLYPAQMYTRELPYGNPVPYNGKYIKDDSYPLYIQHIVCEFELKDGHIPTIQIKDKKYRGMFKKNEYQHDSKGERVDLYLTNIDLELIEKHYHLYDVDYVEGWKFRSKVGLFNQFIDKWTYVKTHETGAKKLLAKLMLNSLYGKFASNPDVTGNVPFLKEDGANGFYLGDEELKDPIYTPMGIFITSWARFTCISSAQKVFDRIIYCDTDSMHLVGEEIPDEIKDIIDPKKLGYWDHEATYQDGRYLKQKTYCHNLYVKKDEKGKWVSANSTDYESIKFSVTCAGMPDEVKEKVTWDNFHIGFKESGALKGKQVNGGMVLMDTDFSIK